MRRTCRSRPLLFAAMLSVWLSADATARAQEGPARTVLTIHQDAPSFPANPVIDAAIRDALVSRVTTPIDYFTEYREVDSLRPEQAGAPFAEYIEAKYHGRHIDLVIAVTDASLEFALQYRETLFAGAPIVYMGLTVPDDATRAAGAGVTGVRVGTAYGQTLRTALALHPGTRQVFVVANSPNPQGVAIVRDELLSAAAGVRLEFLDDTVPRLIDRVKTLPSDSLVLFVRHARRDPGNLLYSDRIAQLVAEASPVPVYGTSDFYVGLGVVGGIMRRTAQTGARLGDLAGRILNGEHARDLPVEPAELATIFDWRQLRRWHIDEAKLPPGSHVQFRIPTLWESDRDYIVGTAVVVVAQLVLIAALVAARARARRAEATVRAREATLRGSYDRIRQLAGRLIHAQEATRADIARDLHDGVCQDLASVSVALAAVKQSSASLNDPQVQADLERIQDEMRSAYDDIRRLSHDLHPSTLRLLGLATALRAHCAEVERRHGVRVAFSVDGELGPIDPDAAVSLFRIAQESLRNGVEHGKARGLDVALARSGESIEMRIADDGKGFDVEQARRGGSGLGLVSMGERAHAFGGDLRVESQPGQGTTIRVRCPAAVARADVSAAAG